jgi:curved DNA-binding protein
LKETAGMKTHYEMLDVAPSATTADIRKAFRSLAFIYHPDLAGPEANNPGLFIRIREAYEVLVDEDRRKAYDSELVEERRHESDAARQQAARVVNVERPRAREVYSPFYTEQRLSRPVEAVLVDPAALQRRPCDISGSIEISLEESLRPSTFTIVLPDNLGSVSGGKVHIKLPGGIYRDAVLRVPGQGLQANGERGDLYIDVVFGAHPEFRLCAESLFYDLTVHPWQAALGFEALVPTLDGFERVDVPPLLSSPCIRRLPGKGIYRRSGERGDLWISMKLEVPPPTSFRARRLWAELAEEYKHATARAENQ